MKNKIHCKRIVLSAVVVFLVLIVSAAVYSHCQIPCGIYDDNMRLDMMAENIAAIEKSMKAINEFSGMEKPDMNQLVRWIDSKDSHANRLSHIVTYYFMAQRIKPADKSDAASYEKYVRNLTILHQILVDSMKSKQATDISVVERLKSLLSQFKTAYLETYGSGHQHH